MPQPVAQALDFAEGMLAVAHRRLTPPSPRPSPCAEGASHAWEFGCFSRVDDAASGSRLTIVAPFSM